MLLLSSELSVTSVRPDQAPVPYWPRRFGGRRLDVLAFLNRMTGLDELEEALVHELTSTPEIMRIGNPRPILMLEEIAAWIADGAILAAEGLPSRLDLRFMATDPWALGDQVPVRFPNARMSELFVERVIRSRQGRQAFDAALAFRPEIRFRIPAGITRPHLWFASHLKAGRLALFPIQGDVRRLRLAWIRHHMLGAVKPAAQPLLGLPSLPSLPSILQALLSTLPDLPDEVSPQAQTLTDASQNGTPFCEDCGASAGA